jgi:hypothetical protein
LRIARIVPLECHVFPADSFIKEDSLEPIH